MCVYSLFLRFQVFGETFSMHLQMNKTGTSKVGAISKAQKISNFLKLSKGGPFGFFEKKEKSKNKNFEPVS